MRNNPENSPQAAKPALYDSLAVCAAAVEDHAVASKLSTRLNLPLLDANHVVATSSKNPPLYAALLVVEGTRLSLQQTGSGAPGPITVDFGSPAMRHRRRGGANELLGKAVGVGKKSSVLVLDATAGLGRDAFVLADLGCRVQLCERQPIIAQLLGAGLASAAEAGDPWLDDVISRMTLFVGDARDYPARETGLVDVIYLDPMFAQRGKSAAAKKDMAAFQRLLRDDASDGDGQSLLEWALAQQTARVVVKRPLKAEPLAGLAPSHSIRGKAVRYDVHVLRKL